MMTRQGVSQRAKNATFSLQCWMDFLEDCRLIQSAKNSSSWGKLLNQAKDSNIFFSLFNAIYAPIRC
jgi:hypothetical protein